MSTNLSGKRAAIVQSNYIPWKGYFDLIASVDEFILYDDVQFTRRDWRSRNVIKVPGGVQWLTIPVRVKGRYLQTIRETEIDGREWCVNHWKALNQSYRRAQYFDEVAREFEPLYLEQSFTHLSVLNRAFIERVCAFLGILTRITYSSDYKLEAGRTERLAGICEQVGACEYVSGPAARDYVDESVFAARSIRLEWFDYQGYPQYPQLWGAFEHRVTILDLLFSCGKNSSKYMKYVPK